ncbi:hypothetical protein [uncultured Polaribacter sp.]
MATSTLLPSQPSLKNAKETIPINQSPDCSLFERSFKSYYF